MKILLVEDETKLAKAIKAGLQQDGYAVDLTLNYEDGLAYATTEEYDVIILDRMLDGGQDGLDICRQLRSQGVGTPVILLTALGQTDDIVDGLNSGADDYLTKPFQFEELLARLRALKRRPAEVKASVIRIADIEIDTNSKLIKKGSGESKPIKLSRKEFAVLEYLAVHSDRISSKQQILSHVWDFESDVLPNTVEVFIKSIRKKIDEPEHPSIIETIRGFGYRLRTDSV